MLRANDRHIAIIGAGATGVAMFIALVRRQAAQYITFIDPYPIGQGLVYANTDPDLICNTSVDLMSVMPLQSNDLLYYLRNNGYRNTTLNDFIERKQLGAYVRERFQFYSKLAAKAGIKVEQILGYAQRIVRTKSNAYMIETDTEPLPFVTEVIICNGFGNPIIPECIHPHTLAPTILTSPYPEQKMIEALSRHNRVLVLGSHLSAIDVALILCRREHSVTIRSPSGMLPAVRTSLVRSPDNLVNHTEVAAIVATIDYRTPDFEQKLSELVIHTIEKITPLPLSAQIAREHSAAQTLRTEIALAQAGKTQWEYALFAIVNALNKVARRQQDPAFTQKIYECCRGSLSRYLGAMPLQNAEKILHHIDANRLRVNHGKLTAVERKENQWQVKWCSGESSTFDAIVCATGNYLPRYHATPETLTLVNDPKQRVTSPELTPELAVKLPGTLRCERIWHIGVASHLIAPFNNGLFFAVDQANEVAQQINLLENQFLIE